MGCQSQLIQLLVGDFDGRFVVVGVQGGLDDQAGPSGGAGNETDDGLMTYQRPTSPVLGNEAEESVFDLVPLAGARGKVAHGEREAAFACQCLEFALPQAYAITIAPATIGSHQ